MAGSRQAPGSCRIVTVTAQGGQQPHRVFATANSNFPTAGATSRLTQADHSGIHERDLIHQAALTLTPRGRVALVRLITGGLVS